MLAFTIVEAQVGDKSKWVNYKNEASCISFIYPSYFVINPGGSILKAKNAICIEYLRYSPVDEKVDSNKAIYLELYSTLTIYVSDFGFDKNAEENNFFKKDGQWFDKGNQYEDSVIAYNLSDWKGLKSTRNTSIGIKGGGTWTSAADEEVLLLIKGIGNHKSIVCFATGFDFPNSTDILKKICNSITIRTK